MKLRGPAGQVATTETKENRGEKQMRSRPATYCETEKKILILFLWEMATLLHWMWKRGDYKERVAVCMCVCLYARSGNRKISVDGVWCQGWGSFSMQQFTGWSLESEWGGGFSSCPTLSSVMKRLFISHDCQGHSVGGDTECLNGLLFPSLKDDLLM